MKTINEGYQWFITRYVKLGYRSLTQFAKDNGYQKSSLSRYFNGEREMPAQTLVSLSIDLGVSPNTILKALGYEF
jgi:transcriptional regulator with XRE-family HTH domain